MKYIIDGDFLREVVDNFSGSKGDKQENIISSISSILSPTLESYSINTKLRIGHFIGQVAHESDCFSTTEEYASGSAYEGRLDLGNDIPGEGKMYKGRAFIQLTGEANYILYGLLLKLPLREHPELACIPSNALNISCMYWSKKKLNQHADANNYLKITKKINGGLNGYEKRKEYTDKALKLLNFFDGTTTANLKIGSSGFLVKELQKKFNKLGYNLKPDGDFGAKTEKAVIDYQKSLNMSGSGIISSVLIF